MKLVYNLLTESFALSKEKLNVLCVENKEEYRKILRGLDQQILTFFENLEQIGNKQIFLLDSFTDFDINTKKNLDNLYKSMENYFYYEAGNEQYAHFMKALYAFSDSLVDKEKYDLVYRDDFQLTSFLKFMDFHFRMDEENYLSNLLDYLEVTTDILHAKIVIASNLLLFLTKEEVNELINLAKKLDLYMITIESIYLEEYGEYNKVVFDKDLCQIC